MSHDASDTTQRRKSRTLFADKVIQNATFDYGIKNRIILEGTINHAPPMTYDPNYYNAENGALYTTPEELAAYIESVSPATIPTAPINIVAIHGNTQATITFNAPSNNGGAPITSYTVLSNPGNVTASGNASPIIITGLTNGVSYTFTVIATNSKGDSEPSAPSNAVIPVGNPSQPTGLSATPGNNQATIAFTAGNNGGSPITNYLYSTDGTNFVELSPADTTSPVTITGLTNGVTYSIYLKSKNTVGVSSASLPISVTPVAPPTPNAPTLILLSPTNEGMYVYFTAGSGTITNYEYTLNSGTSYTAFSPADATSPVFISGLINGNSVSVQLRAVNSGAGVTSSLSNTLTATPSNQSVPDEWLYYDPNNTSSYSGTGSVVNNIGNYGTFTGTKGANVSYVTDNTLNRNVFDFNGVSPITYGSFDFGSLFTISAWVYPRSKANINGILANANSGGNTPGFKFGWNNYQSSDRALVWEAGTGSGMWGVQSSALNTVVLNQWQYLTCVFDNTNRIVLFYKNGLPVDVSVINTAVVVTGPRAFNIGTYGDGSYGMNALLGMIKVYNSMLSASQVINDFNATKSSFGL